MHRGGPTFCMPSDVALGVPGSSGRGTYLATIGMERTQPAREKPDSAPNLARIKPPSAPKPVPSRLQEKTDLAADLDQTAAGGSPSGSRVPGDPLPGHAI